MRKIKEIVMRKLLIVFLILICSSTALCSVKEDYKKAKEEQKYRFNQFWDVTRDRGEYSTANETIWYTEPNGYITNLNRNNINYVKNEFQRKKFRHNNTRIMLRRTVSGNKKMLLQLSTTKVQNSPR